MKFLQIRYTISVRIIALQNQKMDFLLASYLNIDEDFLPGSNASVTTVESNPQFSLASVQIFHGAFATHKVG